MKKNLMNNANLLVIGCVIVGFCAEGCDKFICSIDVCLFCRSGDGDFGGGVFGVTEVLLFAAAGLFISSSNSSRLEQLFS